MLFVFMLFNFCFLVLAFREPSSLRTHFWPFTGVYTGNNRRGSELLCVRAAKVTSKSERLIRASQCSISQAKV
jgi:hypothetical protein